MAKKPETNINEVETVNASENEATPNVETKRAVLAGFKVAKVVTVPLLKFVIDQPIYVKITGPIFLGKETKAASDSKKMEPAHLCNVINLETGEEQQIIVAKVLHSVLDEEYPEQSYIGKCFELTKGAKGSGKSYNPYSVVELVAA